MFKINSKNKVKVNDAFSKGVTIGIWIFMLAYSLTILAIYFWVIMSSFKGELNWMEDNFGFPTSITFENYSNALSKFYVLIFPPSGGQRNIYMLELLLNTFIYVLGCSIFATITPCIVAYAASKFKFGFNKVLDAIVVITMILPIIGALPAEIAMTKALGFYGTFPGIFFMKASFLGMNYFLFKSAFIGVDKAYMEAAKVDGASQLTVMIKIMIPMVSNILWLIFLLQIMGYWGDWNTPMIYIPYNPTIAYALFNMQFSNDPILSYKPVQLAACIMVSIPTLIAFIAFRNKIMGGLAFGGLKG